MIERLRRTNCRSTAKWRHLLNVVKSFLEDQDGSVWAAAADGLGHFSGGRWQRIGANMHFDSPEASYLFQDRAGTLWITTTNHVYALFKGAKAFVKSGYKTTEYAQCAQAPDGTVWIEDPLGLVPLTPKMPKSFPPKARLLAVKDSNGLYFDRDGTLWEFPLHGGVRRLSYPSAVATTPVENRAASVQHFMHADGLTSDLMSASSKIMRAIYGSQHRAVWINFEQLSLHQLRYHRRSKVLLLPLLPRERC
jgi:ligand-binding sensor domain-containing protein